MEEKKRQYNEAPSFLYPESPNPPLPLSAPLSEYEGTYYHPAYRNITLHVKGDSLHGSRLDVTWPLSLDLKHITGDFFVTYMDYAYGAGYSFKEVAPAEFRIGKTGKPISLGIGFEPKMGTDQLIWFDKV